MIVLKRPEDIGKALMDIRVMLLMSRRELARELMDVTGRTESSINAQLWTWDEGHRTPQFTTLGPVLQLLGYRLALVPIKDGEESSEEGEGQ